MPAILHHELMDSVLFEWNLGGQKKYLNAEELRIIQKNVFIRKHTFEDATKGNYSYEGGVDMHITRRVAQMIVIGLLLIALGLIARYKIAANITRINGRFANAMEFLFTYFRKKIAEENMPGHGETYHPFLMTLFLYILLLNLAGLMPQMGQALDYLTQPAQLTEAGQLTQAGEQGQGDHANSSFWLAIWPGITATGDISVTFTLALTTICMIWFAGFRYQGISFLWNVVPKGVPLPLYVIMWPLEFIVGPIAKGFALMIRLLANMTAGHVVILVLLSFIFNAAPLWNSTFLSKIGAGGITLISLGGIIGIFMLEILVSVLQAFIFTLLSALFISSSMHRH